MNGHLVHVILCMLRKLMYRTTIDKHRIAAYEYMLQAATIVDNSSLFLTTEQAGQLSDSVNLFLLHYNVLTNHAVVVGTPRYNIVPKFHALIHIAAFGVYQSPEASWCYAFEDFIGRVQKCAKSCTVGTPMQKVPLKCMENYLFVLRWQLRGVGPTGTQCGRLE